MVLICIYIYIYIPKVVFMQLIKYYYNYHLYFIVWNRYSYITVTRIHLKKIKSSYPPKMVGRLTWSIIFMAIYRFAAFIHMNYKSFPCPNLRCSQILYPYRTVHNLNTRTGDTTRILDRPLNWLKELLDLAPFWLSYW